MAIVAALVAFKHVVGASVFVDRAPFALMLVGVVVAAWYGGFGPGVLAALLGATATDFFFISPVYALGSEDADDWIQMGGFVAEAVAISAIGGSMRTSRSTAFEERRRALREVEQRRAAEKEEREGRMQLQAILSSVADGITAQLPDGRLIFANEAAARAIGYASVGEMLSSTLAERARPYEFLRDDGTLLTLDELPGNVALRTGAPQERRLRYRIRGAAEIRTSLIRCVPVLEENGRPLMVITAFHDVTEEARVSAERERRLDAERAAREHADALARENAALLEEARTASRARDEFLATLSHELRTPLHAILGWARVLRTNKLPESTRARALSSMERNALAQTQLIDDLLDMSRIINGKLRIRLEPTDLVRLTREALESARPAADAKHIAIVLDVGIEQEATVVRGDADRLQQIVWNLLSNAIKFTPPGGRVSLRLARVGEEVVVEVTDTGVGIAPSFLPHVFERFRQADSSSTRAFGGLGLGLAIVRHLVELHGGRVEAESPGEGKGATFRVRLPAFEGAGVAPARHAREPLRPGALEGVSVLVVDDDPDALEMLRAALETSGARVSVALSAEEAMDRVGRGVPEVVVADIGMPGTDGYALLRQLHAAHSDLPVLALTAYAAPDDKRRALAAGFSRHLAKPVDPVELALAIAAIAPRHPA